MIKASLKGEQINLSRVNALLSEIDTFRGDPIQFIKTITSSFFEYLSEECK